MIDLIAMSGFSAQGANGLVQFLPFALILGIFYFMILLPMKKRQKKVKLELDLKGGVHLQIKVNTDDAMKLTTTSTSEQLRESLKTVGINPTLITSPSPTTFRVEGVPSDKDSQFRQSADEIAATNY